MRPDVSVATLLAMLALAAALLAGSCKEELPACAAVPRRPEISPDYAGVVVPPNIAPLNFVIREPGREYRVTIQAVAGGPIEVVSKTGEIAIPQRKWRDLLNRNAGKELRFDVCVKTESGTWNRYQTIVNTQTSNRSSLPAFR